MDSTNTKRTARFAGLLYLLASVPGAFALLYVPGRLVVRGDAAATADRLRTSGNLLRLGIGAELLGSVVFIFMVLVLHRLFRAASPEPARAMLVLILLSMPISMVAVVPEVAALELAGGAGAPRYLSALDTHSRDALAYYGLHLHGQAIQVAQIFWGLWLFPFGVCVIRSRFIPRFLGFLLIAAAFGYLGASSAELVAPQFADAVQRVTRLLTVLELPIIFWLLIWGARPQSPAR
jgi:hypothetical protein